MIAADAVDAAAERGFLTAELPEIQRQSKALWARLRHGEDSSVLRARIDRLERLLMGPGWFTEVLAEVGDAAPLAQRRPPTSPSEGQAGVFSVWTCGRTRQLSG
jgi:hypothetical protein